jgi:signal transduction histidine kinase
MFVSVLLLAGLFAFTFLLTRRFLWQGLKAVGVAKHTRVAERLDREFFELTPSQMTERLRQLAPSISPQFYIEFILEGHGRLFATPNLRGASLAEEGRSDNVYLKTIPGRGDFYVQTFHDGPLTIRLGQDLDNSNIVLDAYARATIVLFVAVVILSGLQAWWGARLALRPVAAMQKAAERISGSNLGERIPVTRANDEIAALGALLNRTFERLQNSFEQIRRFTADASHELRTPLTVARAHAEKLLRPDLGHAAQEEAAHGLLAELTHFEHIIEDLLLLARSDARGLPFHPVPLSTEEFWMEVVPEIQALAEFHEVELNVDFHGQGTAHADKRWLRHVVLNLVNNAIRHSPRGGTLRVCSRVDGKVWRIEIQDHGTGVPPEKLELIFERFFQVRPNANESMEGTGLGLAICRSLVEMHGGAIHAVNLEPGPGLVVVIDLPAQPVPAAAFISV